MKLKDRESPRFCPTMASRQPERYIPHVCDVFRLPASSSIRDAGGVSGISKGAKVCPDKKYTSYEDHSDEDHYDYDGISGGSRHHKGRGNDTSGTTRTNNNRHQNYSHALTEKDLQHIERHLSMKKTIRKQLSRHLSQAFVEYENESRTGRQNGDRDDRSGKRPLAPGPTSGGMANYSLTFSRSNVAKSDTNFLDFLKEVHEDVEDDSGHCSPTRDMDNTDSTVAPQETSWNVGKTTPSRGKYGGPILPTTGQTGEDQLAADTKKSTFWKKLTVRSKSKR